MQNDNTLQALEQQLTVLVGDFQKAIAEGRPFAEVKRIYLQIKEVKVEIARHNATVKN